jgi:cellulose synthase/poly-beta-1,6-N-acetylglucosamine synthase-like glycosyltransferase
MGFSSILLDISIFFGLYFQIFLLVTYFGADDTDAKYFSSASKKPPLPTVTIVVPCFNEEKTVVKTIRSLLALNYPKNKLSILVVDDGSADATYETAKTVNDPRVTVVRQKNGGKHTALNYGIAQAKTDIIGCLDADSTVDSEALLRMVPYFNNPKVMAVTPAMRVHEPKNILQKMQHAEYNLGIFAKRVFGLMDAINVTPGPFSIFRKRVFDEIGMFRPAHNTEDMEIAFRIQSFQYKIANCHRAYVYTITPNTFKKLYKQRTRWSYGFIKNMIDYRRILLNKKYGDMGMLTLPFSLIGIIMCFYVISKLTYDLGDGIIHRIQKMLTVGFHMPHLSFDFFFVNTGLTTILALILISTTISILFLGKKMAQNSLKPSTDIMWYVLLYGFVAPIWLGKAVYNVALSKKTPWR